MKIVVPQQRHGDDSCPSAGPALAGDTGADAADGQKYLTSVYVVMRVTVALARQGLVRTVLTLGKTHQEAARCLIAGARPPMSSGRMRA